MIIELDLDKKTCHLKNGDPCPMSGNGVYCQWQKQLTPGSKRLSECLQQEAAKHSLDKDANNATDKT